MIHLAFRIDFDEITTKNVGYLRLTGLEYSTRHVVRPCSPRPLIGHAIQSVTVTCGEKEKQQIRSMRGQK